MRGLGKEYLIARTRRVSTSVRKVCGSLTKPSRDVFQATKQIFRSAVFAAIGGIITVAILKFLETEVTAAQREIRDEDELNEADRQPQKK